MLHGGSVYLVGAYKGLYSEKFEDGLSCRIFNKYKNLSFIILAFYLIVFFFVEGSGLTYTICLNIYKYISPFLLWSLSNRMIKFGTILQKHWWSQITFIVMIVGASIIRKNSMCWSLLTGGRGK